MNLEPWVLDILADPIKKQPIPTSAFPCKESVLDARVLLKNTYGYSTWEEGQVEYENSEGKTGTPVESYRAEIDYERPIYKYYRLSGRILDSGGGAGTVREFLPNDVQFISIDPWLQAPFSSSPARRHAYTCLNRPFNFIAATAEFLPFIADSFDWVHMRSVLDHVQIPDLAVLEAYRVLRKGGKLLVGLYVEGGKSGLVPFSRRLKKLIKAVLGTMGIDRWKDHHIWHPTYDILEKLITENGFEVEDTYWQEHWNDSVCFICARKKK